MWLGIFLGLVLLNGLLSGAGIAVPKKINLAMTYIPNVQFAPWYVAAEKGFFQEEGLAVNFDYRMDIDAIPLVGNGQMDFAVAGGDQLIIARSQGIPVVYLANLYAKFPPAVVALAESNIKTPRDLIGKKIGLPLYGSSLLAIKVILKKAGIKEGAVELVDIGYTQIPSLTTHQVDAVVGFANNEPLKLKDMGYQVNEIVAWDYFTLVGHGLITSEKMIANSPQTVHGMVRATVRGMKYALEHPDETLAICLKYLPELGAQSKEFEKKVLMASMKLWENNYTGKKGLGYSDPQVWADSQRIMLDLGIIKKTTPVETMVNFKFLY